MNSDAYMNSYMKQRYADRRARAFHLLGGKCKSCGSIHNMNLDHIDPTTKSFSFGKIWSCKLEIFDEELKKAQILCESCHKQKTISENSVPHGGGKSGKRNCPCTLCRAKKAEYMRARKNKAH